MTAPGAGFSIGFHFHGELTFFVRPKRGTSFVHRKLREKTSVKDAIEACGVPHPEIDLILINGAPVSVRHCLESDATIDAYPLSPDTHLFLNTRLQQRGVARFVADGHLGKTDAGSAIVGRCHQCGQIYLSGSHFEKLRKRVERLRGRPNRVGLKGFEPLTLRLSSACSNQLSYRPGRREARRRSE